MNGIISSNRNDVIAPVSNTINVIDIIKVNLGHGDDGAVDREVHPVRNVVVRIGVNNAKPEIHAFASYFGEIILGIQAWWRVGQF